MPSRITAMVALCTTLSVRQTGAMGAETSVGCFPARMTEIFQTIITHGHCTKSQVTYIIKLHICIQCEHASIYCVYTYIYSKNV